MFEEEKETLLPLSLFSIIYPKKKRPPQLEFLAALSISCLRNALRKTFRYDSGACAAGKGKVSLIFGAARLACVF